VSGSALRSVPVVVLYPALVAIFLILITMVLRICVVAVVLCGVCFDVRLHRVAVDAELSFRDVASFDFSVTNEVVDGCFS